MPMAVSLSCCVITELKSNFRKVSFWSMIIKNLERGKRIELSASAWKAEVLPLYEPRIRLTYYLSHCTPYVRESWLRVTESNRRSGAYETPEIPLLQPAITIYSSFSACRVATVSSDKGISVLTLNSRISSLSFCFCFLRLRTSSLACAICSLLRTLVLTVSL